MRKLAILTVALLAALSAGVLAVTAGSGSSHREAPLSSLDPTGDDTDVYAFVAPDAPGSLTLIGNWIPFEDPAGGPNFYRFDDRASYYLNVDNTGDGKYDIRYRFKFKTKARNPNSFLYALPGVSSINDPKLNLVQTYSVSRERYERGHLVSSKLLASGLPVAPNNVGPKTFPNYDAVANQAIKGLPGGGKVFAGQVDDPFFVDLGSTFDAINIDMPGRMGIGTGNQGGGKDDLAGYNVHTIALQVPKTDVTRDGKTPADAKASNAVVGVWASTYRPVLQVDPPEPGGQRGQLQRVQARAAGLRRPRRGPGQPPRQPARQRGGHPAGSEGQVQRDPAVRRPEELRQVRALAGARQGHQHPVPGPQRAREQPHGHRAGAAHGHSGPDPDRPGRAPDRHAEDQPRRGAEPEARAASASSAVTPRASRTGAA